MTETELRYQLALWRAPKISPALFQVLLDHWKTAQHLFHTHHKELQRIGLSDETLTYLRNPNWELVDRDLQWKNQANHHILTLTMLNYPPLLKEISNPPPILFVIGNIEILHQPQIAIVGSRNPTPAGLEIAFDMAAALAQVPLVITSGLALGIDGAAHRGALHVNGKTIAVLGNGLSTIYPARHQKLAASIVESGGALVSEFPPDTKPLSAHFPQRNRIISGLCLGTLVVEASLRSGSLITASLAASQNREVFAIPGSIRNPLTRGCHRLIQQGAKLVESVADIIAELRIGGITPAQPGRSIDTIPKPILDEEYQKLIECIGFEATSLDQLAARSGLSAQRVAILLLEMELAGSIQTIPGGYMRVKQ